MFDEDNYQSALRAYLTRNLDDPTLSPDVEELAEEFDCDFNQLAKQIRQGGYAERRLKAQEIESKAIERSDKELVAARATDLTKLRKDLFIDRAHVVESLKAPLLEALKNKLSEEGMGGMKGSEIVAALALVMKVSESIEKEIAEVQKGAEDKDKSTPASKSLGSIREKAEVRNIVTKNPKANQRRQAMREDLDKWGEK